MTNPAQHPIFILPSSLRGSAVAVVLLCLLSVILTQSAQAQTFTVLHNFTGGQDGATPTGGITLDQAGNLYGTTSTGGNTGRLLHRWASSARVRHGLPAKARELRVGL